MNNIGSTTFVTAIATGRRQIEQLEEERMTGYPEDHADWEFKIIRSPWWQFANPEARDAMLEREAQAQWELVEIFDAQRIRLRRPVSARELDGKLPDDYDPYGIIDEVPKFGVGSQLVVGVLACLAVVFAGIILADIL